MYRCRSCNRSMWLAGILLSGLAAAIPECKLQLIGKAGGGLKHASLACTGGTVTIAVNETYLGRFKAGFKGVEWDPGHCSALPCMLTFCGNSNAKLPNVVIRGIEEMYLLGLLCGAGSSTLFISGAEMTRNTISTVLNLEEKANITVLNSVISANTGDKGSFLYCAYGEASLTILSSQFSMNEALCNVVALGSAAVVLDRVTIANNTLVGKSALVLADERAHMVIVNSIINTNHGTAMGSDGNATVVIEHSRIEHNVLSDDYVGAGLSACGDSTVTLNNATVHNNTASQCAGIHAQDGAVVTVNGGSIISSNNGGGLCGWGNANLTVLEGTLVADNTAATGALLAAAESSGGGVLADDNVTLKMTGTVLRNNSVKRNAGGAMYLGGNATATITDSLLVNNFASSASGGGLRAGGNATITLQRCDFVNNTATNALGGGGLSVGEQAYVLIEECEFHNNTAVYSSGGGMSVRNKAVVKVVRTMFRQNTAEIEGGAVYVLDGGVVSITGGSEFVGNSANFTGGDIRAGADRNLVLEDANVNLSSPTVQWTRQACVPGESLQGAAGCRPCQMRTYSVVVNSSMCYACPDGAVCPGGNSILPEANLWHSHRYSTQIHACPREKICEVGGVCAAGYTGNVCGGCLAGYGSRGPFHCAACMSLAKTLAAFLGAVVLMVCLIAVVVHTTLGDTQQSRYGVRPSDLLRVLVRHLQYLAIISTLRVQWPQTLNFIFGAVNYVFNVASSQVISLDCVFSAERWPPLAIKRVLTYLLAPLAILGVLVFVWLLVRCVKMAERFRSHSSRQQQPVGDVITVICLVVLFFFYPALVRIALSMFACYKLDDLAKTDFAQFAAASAPHGYWVYSMQQACWEGWHVYWAGGLGVPCVFLFCLAVPVGMWWLLYRSRSKIALPSYVSPLAFLYHNYKSKRWYWEVVSTVQIALLVAISVFSFTLGAYFTTVLLNLSLVIFWAVQLIYEPFASKELHLTSLLSLACLYATTGIALTLFTVSRVSAPQLYGDIIGVVGLVMNALFVLGCCYRIAVHGSGVVAVWLRKLFACIGFGAAKQTPTTCISSTSP